MNLRLDGSTLTIKDLLPLIRDNICSQLQVSIDPNLFDKILESRETVDTIVFRKLPVYGISTGFGKFKEIYIPSDQMVNLQKNLIISHASCVGECYEPYQVLIMMILRLNCLVRGYSGVRMELLMKLQEAINKRVIPKVPKQGSVGASGDLAPLSHLALGLMGMGDLWDDELREFVPAEQILKLKNYEPIVYMEKEGLAMNNGTQMMSMVNLEICHRAETILRVANIALAMSLFTSRGLLYIIQLLCPVNLFHILGLPNKLFCRGAQQIVSEIKNAFKGYEEYKKHTDFKSQIGCNPRSIQTAISAHGGVQDSLIYAKRMIEREMNSTSDNPIIDNEDLNAKSGGNFHGEYMAQVGDMMGIAIQRLGIYSERRQERLVNSELGECGLPMFLTGKGGILNGYMIPQYASAALVSENKVLSHPSCVDTVPTSANIEDHVSMGGMSVRKGLQLVKNVEYIVSVELMCGCQALEFMISKGDIEIPARLMSVRNQIRELVPDTTNQVTSHIILLLSKDIFMSKYIEIVASQVRAGNITI